MNGRRVCRWRSPDNAWRKFGTPALPTLYKVTSDGVSAVFFFFPSRTQNADGSQAWSKLVEAEVYDLKKLDAFVAAN